MLPASARSSHHAAPRPNRIQHRKCHSLLPAIAGFQCRQFVGVGDLVETESLKFLLNPGRLKWEQFLSLDHWRSEDAAQLMPDPHWVVVICVENDQMPGLSDGPKCGATQAGAPVPANDPRAGVALHGRMVRAVSTAGAGLTWPGRCYADR